MTELERAGIPQVDYATLATPQFFDDPYPTYRRLRERAPVVRIAGSNSYLVIGFDEVYHVLRHHELYSSDGQRVVAVVVPSQ